VLIQAFRLPAFIVTLAGMFLARGLCYLISIDSIAIRRPLFGSLSRRRAARAGAAGEVSPAWRWRLVVLLLAVLVAQRTAFGRTVYAIGGNEASALHDGPAVRARASRLYALSGFCAALGGLLFALYTLSGYGLHGRALELDAIAAVVIGGALLRRPGLRGRLRDRRADCSALIQTLIAFDGTLSSWWTRIVIGALLFLFCVMQRLLARRAGALIESFTSMRLRFALAAVAAAFALSTQAAPNPLVRPAVHRRPRRAGGRRPRVPLRRPRRSAARGQGLCDA
jgi:ribose/xylose/arabinose/galactoside ABC-type transport system permease subunit